MVPVRTELGLQVGRDANVRHVEVRSSAALGAAAACHGSARGLRDDRGDNGGDLVGAADTIEPGSDRVSSATELLVAELATEGTGVGDDDDEAAAVDFSRRA